MSAPIAITGAGLVLPPPTGDLALSPVDAGGAGLWARLEAGAGALGPSPTRRKELELPAACAFPKDFAAEKHLKLRAIRKAANTSRMAVVAAHAALADAGLEAPGARDGASVIVGTCFGCSAYYLKFHQAVLEKGPKGANAVLFTESVFNAAAGHVSMAFGLRGASLVVAGGEESGLSALVAAHDRLRLGAVEVALSGGVDEYADLVHASLRAEGRVGLGLDGLDAAEPGPYAEGAALFVLQRTGSGQAYVLGAARARPGRTGDAAAAVERAARVACAEAGVAPAAVDLYVGGGSGGARSVAERAALGRLAAGAASPRAVCAPQALLGEGFGFTSAALVAVALQALRRQAVPPTVGPSSFPAALDPGAGPRPLRHALVVSSSAPGGAAALVLGAV